MASWVASFLGSVSSLWTSSGEAKQPHESGQAPLPGPTVSLERSPTTDGSGPPGARCGGVDASTEPLERKQAARPLQDHLNASDPSTSFLAAALPPDESHVSQELDTFGSTDPSLSEVGADSVRLEPLPREVEAAM
jgi:hypothetical protein